MSYPTLPPELPPTSQAAQSSALPTIAAAPALGLLQPPTGKSSPKIQPAADQETANSSPIAAAIAKYAAPEAFDYSTTRNSEPIPPLSQAVALPPAPFDQATTTELVPSTVASIDAAEVDAAEANPVGAIAEHDRSSSAIASAVSTFASNRSELAEVKPSASIAPVEPPAPLQPLPSAPIPVTRANSLRVNESASTEAESLQMLSVRSSWPSVGSTGAGAIVGVTQPQLPLPTLPWGYLPPRAWLQPSRPLGPISAVITTAQAGSPPAVPPSASPSAPPRVDPPILEPPMLESPADTLPVNGSDSLETDDPVFPNEPSMPTDDAREEDALEDSIPEEANPEQDRPTDEGPVIDEPFFNEPFDEPGEDEPTLNDPPNEPAIDAIDEASDEVDGDGIADPEVVNPTPRGATPEPFWRNGAIRNDGTLLTPTQPTNRPPAPLNITADRQEFEPFSQVITASGNVVLQLGNGVLAADKLWANLFNRFVLVEGNVRFRQGEQIIEAERGEYNLQQGQGSLFDARGTLQLTDIDDDFASIVPEDDVTRPRNIANLLQQEPLDNVRSTGGINFSTAGGISAENGANVSNIEAGGAGVRRIRFEADQVDFDASGWVARDIRLTNDPFSPPELEFRGDVATLTPLNPTEDELLIENGRIVFDQRFSVPIFRSRFLLQRGGSDEANPFFVSFGYDGEERGGLFVERSFAVAETPRWRLRVTPQVLLQRFLSGEETSSLSNLGFIADLDGRLGPRTTVSATADLSGLDLDNVRNRLRSSVRLQQALGDHRLNLEYSYRDRLFNGSLGFQNVQSSIGAVLESPRYRLGNTGIVLDYQAGAQYITAITDRDDLLEGGDDDDLVSLGRFQGTFSLTRGFSLWRGEPLPRTRDEGLRFTPNPVVPNIRLVLQGRGTYSYYTSNDTQENLDASVALVGQLGHFSRDFFDSTTFNISYRRSFVGDDSSPFRFDRNADRNVLSGGIIQQIYGPIRLGFQVGFNLDTGEVINTDYVLEYSRRTYGLVLRFNPERRTGFLGFRLNEFGWSGRAARFGGADIRQVEGGVVR